MNTRQLVTIMGGVKQFAVYTDATNTSTFDPSWVFSVGGGPMTVDWGDGSAKESHATALSHTYAEGSGRHKVIFTCPDWSKVTTFDVQSDVCQLKPPDLSKLVNLDTLYLKTNRFTSLQTISHLTKLYIYDASANSINGSGLPTPPVSAALDTFSVSTETYNSSIGLTGSIPAFPGCTNIRKIYCHENSLSGTIPSFAENTKLTDVRMQTNQLTGYVSGGFATQKSLATLNIVSNLLSQTAVDNILADLVTSLSIPDRATCTLTLGGEVVTSRNGIASSSGSADITTLKAAGWTVLANESPNILIFGDSISVSTEWPTLFRPAYKSGRCTVSSFAVGGAIVVTNGQGGTIYVSTQISSPLNTGADYAILLAGVNDGAYQDADFRVAYQQRITDIMTANPSATVLCLGILDTSYWVSANCAAKNTLIQTACTNTGATFVDTTGWIVYATDTSDGVHPNAAGKLKISNAVIALLPA